jgi:hypothetical protein
MGVSLPHPRLCWNALSGWIWRVWFDLAGKSHWQCCWRAMLWPCWGRSWCT